MWPRHYPRRRKYLVGVSGGCDSVVLLELLVHAGYTKLVVCHLDHRLRGAASRADARFVARLAARHGIPFETAAVDVTRSSSERRVSVETAGREERLAFFAATGRRHRCHRLMLAHHADDQVETVLMNLCRGAGTRGLGGMAAVSKHGEVEILRPLLGTWREEIEAFATENGIRFRTDESNRDTALTRNRVRHRALPALEKILGRDIRAAVLRTADIARADDGYLESVSRTAAAEVSRADGSLSAGPLQGLHLAVARRVVFGWLRLQGVGDLRLGVVDEILAIADPANVRASVNLPGQLRVRRRAGVLFVEAQHRASP